MSILHVEPISPAGPEFGIDPGDTRIQHPHPTIVAWLDFLCGRACCIRELTFNGFTVLWFVILSRTALFSALWWILAGDSPSSWYVGVPAIVLALGASVWLFPSKQVIWRNLIVFVPRFLLRSLQGGIDVAWRAFHYAMPIAPELVEYPLRLPPGLPQVFMANTVSLLPGTLSATIESNILTVHVLNSRGDVHAELRKVEVDVARLFVGNAGQEY